MIEILTFDEWQQWLRDNMDYIYKMKEKFQRDEYDMPPPGDYPIEGGAYINFINMGTQQTPAWKENVFNVQYVQKVKFALPLEKGGGMIWWLDNQIINKRITYTGHTIVDYIERWGDEWNRRGRFYIGEPIKKGGVASDYDRRFLNWSLKNPWGVKE